MQTRSAVLLGASGLVGGECLALLLRDERYDRIVLPVRRPLGLSNPKAVETVVDFEGLAQNNALFTVDDIYCCLGTTIAKAGSQEAFRAVDFGYCTAAAQAAAAAGAGRFLLVSSIGADASSKIFYNRVKGETEREIARYPFAHTVIFRPSIIDGHRTEFRAGERIGLMLMRPFAPLLGRYRPIKASAIARAMVHAAFETEPGIRILESDMIQRLSERDVNGLRAGAA